MFGLNSGSLLSIVLDVRCTDVFTHKSLKNKGDFSLLRWRDYSNRLFLGN